jgi:trans-aconitate 2-methyltransferase
MARSSKPARDESLAAPGAPRDWDAATYDRISDPMLRMGVAVLDRLPLAGDELVLDAGCGSGRVTEALAARLPRGHVVALDGSPSMIAEARRRLARFGDRVSYLVADLGRPLPLPQPVDAILSTATFHWIADHDALFRNLAAVLRPGGRLTAQCGGAGNIESVLRAVETVGDGWRGPHRFETPAATRARLEAAGFSEIDCRLVRETVELERGEPLETYLATIVLGAHLERLPPTEREGFVRAVADRLPAPVLDYVRLDIDAVRG